MKLSEMKSALTQLENIRFRLPNGEFVPEHFHITEIGKIAKQFIDCGGTHRDERMVNLQLWYADDEDHRLLPNKLLNIIQLSENQLQIDDLEIEVEYQTETIGKYGLDFDGEFFLLIAKQTNCLAQDQCGITPTAKPKIKLSDLNSTSCCSTQGNCC